MRGPDSDPLSPEIATALMAVDATLAGEPVDPEYAGLAELALILRRERPRTSDTFAATLDDRVERRFARPARAARGTGLRRWLFGPVAGLAAAAAGVAVVIVVAGSSGGGASSASSSSAAAVASQTVAASSSASAGGSAAAAPDVKRAAAPKTALGLNESAAAASSASSASSSSTSAGSSAVPSPVIPGGRQVVQSAQLQLSTAPSRIDDVAQQVFNVVGAEKGFVDNSNVTSGGGSANAGASFELSVPSANLAATLTDLSRLRGAHVVSRTDQTNDITGEVGGAGQKLAEARALRRSLLKQLANATTTEQVNSIEARLHDANASIASDLATLRGLQRQVAYSKISLNIEPSTAPPPVTTHHSSGFGIGQAAHDAGRVLVVVAGVALIVLAVLVPVGLVGALAAWVGFAIRRRRREQALDLV
ncbi:MAG: DUF4349 domain-containing protein [Solirubrobacteraceae bacterium]